MSSDTISAVQQSAHLVARNSSYVQQADSQKQQRTESGDTTAGRDQVALGVGSSWQSLDTMHRIDNITDALNTTANSIRETGNALKSSADIVFKMEGELSRIVKNYPPFSIEDEDRKKILMSYVSLRKQIEKLTVPSPPPPIYEKVEGMWQELFTQQEGKVSTPVLEEQSSDSRVQSAARQLAATGGAISRVLTSIEASL